jgi:hypothetical protein
MSSRSQLGRANDPVHPLLSFLVMDCSVTCGLRANGNLDRPAIPHRFRELQRAARFVGAAISYGVVFKLISVRLSRRQV